MSRMGRSFIAKALGRPARWLSICAILAPLITLFDGLAAAPIFAICAMMMIASGWSERPWRGVPASLAIPFGLALAWALVSCLWTVTPGMQPLRTLASVTGSVSLGLMAAAVAARLDAPERARVGLCLAIGATLTGSLLLLETLTDFTLTRHVYAILRGHPPADILDSMVSRGVVLLFLMSWPALLAVFRRFGWAAAAALFAILAAGVIGDGKHAIMLAMVVGILVFTATLAAPKVVPHALKGATVAIILATPLLGLALPPVAELGRIEMFNSARHRMVIWHFALDRLAEHPWRGWGMDAAREMPGADDPTTITVIGRSGKTEVVDYPNMPLHPHNGFLQVWLELGIPGALILIAILWGVVEALRRSATGTAERAIATAATASALVIAMVSFGLWQAWWQASLWLTAILLAAVMAPDRESAP